MEGPFLMVGVSQTLPVNDSMGRKPMQMPEDVARMLRLKAATPHGC